MAYDDKRIFDPTSLGRDLDAGVRDELPYTAKEATAAAAPDATFVPLKMPSITVVPGKSDMELAQDYRDRINPHLQAICDITTEARKRDIVMNFQFNIDGMGRTFVTELTVMKKL